MRLMSSRFGVAMLAAGAVCVCAPGSAAAQNVQGAPLTRTEINGRFTFLFSGIGGGGAFTWNFNERHAIQAGAEYLLLPFDFNSLLVPYTVEYRLSMPVRSAKTRVFVTAGGLGTLTAIRWRMIRFYYVNPQGELIMLPTFPQPSGTYFHVTAPISPIFGGGIEHRITRHVAIRADGRLAFHEDNALLLFSGGVTVALGAPLARSR